mmetsp:Transcript_16411/g.40067  ORF Transcript_16411/g.40067 Transcript_16411/m.40067 type:complete len:93 (-) Transcript_16411:195-473(-)
MFLLDSLVPTKVSDISIEWGPLVGESMGEPHREREVWKSGTQHGGTMTSIEDMVTMMSWIGCAAAGSAGPACAEGNVGPDKPPSFESLFVDA